MLDINEAGSLPITICTVSLDAADQEAVMAVVGQQNRMVNMLSFATYVSTKRRPYIPDHLKANQGCIALVDFATDPEQAALAIAYLEQAFRGKLLPVAVNRDLSADVLLVAMRAGCKELVTAPIQPLALVKLIDQAAMFFTEQKATSQNHGSVIAFLGAKGGVGTTTLAVHLAAYLVQDCSKRVLLIDNQAQFGHVCIYLGLDGTAAHFQEIVRNVDRLDSELLKSFVANHTSGLHVLSSPDLGQAARTMHPEDVTATLDFLRGEYDLILVDCAGRLDEVSRAVVAAASLVYVVATPEISAVRDLSRYVDDLTRLDDSSKVKAVINRYSSQFAVSLAEIEKAIRMPVTHSIPNSYIELVRSANLGEPLSATVSNGFTQELTRWARSLVGLSHGDAHANPVGKPTMKAYTRLHKAINKFGLRSRIEWGR